MIILGWFLAIGNLMWAVAMFHLALNGYPILGAIGVCNAVTAVQIVGSIWRS